MNLTITQQKIKGGAEVLFVRYGTMRLLSFPLSMRKLAEAMCAEGAHMDYADAPVLVKSYTDQRGELARKQAEPAWPSPPPTNKHKEAAPVTEKHTNWVPPTPIQPEAPQPVHMMGVEIVSANETTTVGEWLQSPASAPSDQPDDPLATLLKTACEAEKRYLEADAKYKQAMIEHAEAANAATVAWEVFNDELRASMPDVSRLIGVKWLDQPVAWANSGRTVGE